jgi:hypothetical protein
MDYKRKESDSKKADKIIAIAEKSIEVAMRFLSTIEDREARIQALVNLYNITRDLSLLKEACELAETDEDILRIVEYSKIEGVDELELIEALALTIPPGYRRDVAFSILLERTGDLNYASKIGDIRILSSSLKRLALKKRYPENLSIARMIPDHYYKCLALIKLAEKEKINLKKEIMEYAEKIKSNYLRSKIISKLNSLQTLQT